MKNIIKKKRKYNLRILRRMRCYSFAEIAELLDIHIRTIQIWRKEGLKIIDENTKPYLAMGYDVREFLELKKKKSKKPLQEGEFFCPRCRSPRKSIPERITVEITQRKLGKASKQALLRGVCEGCFQTLILFSSDKKVEEMRKNGVIPSELLTVLSGNDEGSVNIDIFRGEQC